MIQMEFGLNLPLGMLQLVEQPGYVHLCNIHIQQSI